MRRLSKLIGVSITCFGLGIMLTFFLPVSILIIIEAAVIITAGFLFINC